MNVLSLRCRGCAYIATPARARVDGHEVGILILRDRCPNCGGRMQELYLGKLYAARIRHEEQELL